MRSERKSTIRAPPVAFQMSDALSVNQFTVRPQKYVRLASYLGRLHRLKYVPKRKTGLLANAKIAITETIVPRK